MAHVKSLYNKMKIYLIFEKLESKRNLYCVKKKLMTNNLIILSIYTEIIFQISFILWLN